MIPHIIDRKHLLEKNASFLLMYHR